MTTCFGSDHHHHQGTQLQGQKTQFFFVISGFRREVEDNCALLGDCAQRVVLIPDGPVFRVGV